LDLRRVTVGVLAEEHQRVPALLVIAAAELGEPEALAEEVQRRRQIADTDHRMQVAHSVSLADFGYPARDERAQRLRHGAQANPTPCVMTRRAAPRSSWRPCAAWAGCSPKLSELR